MKKKTKVFKPCKNPRYLKDAVPRNVWKSDLVEFNKHRYHVFTATTKLDTKPPKMNPFNYINLRQLSNDAERLKQIDQENKNLVKAINTINRTIGRVDSYNPQAYSSQSKWKAHVDKMKRIEKDNKAIYKKLIATTSNYSIETFREFWKGIWEKLNAGTKFPLVILEKKNTDEIIAKQLSISAGLDKIGDRPMCFMEFQVQDGPNLGRIHIELYHDHVPVTVQNFLNICSGENKKDLSYKNSLVYRIVPGKYLETGDITKQTGRGGSSIYGKYFPEEGHKLHHTKAGVLSMVRVRKHDNNSKFCITFGSMETLDRQNVVFGRVVQGIDNLMKIEGYGRKIGKPLAPIYIVNCGKL